MVYDSWLIIIGAIVGAGIAEVGRWRTEKDRLRKELFDKRLQAHQSAFGQVQRLIQAVTDMKMGAIKAYVMEAQEWWNFNCLYLDPNSRSEFASLFGIAEKYSDGVENARRIIWERLHITEQSILRGIGFEYLPKKIRTPDELQKVI